MAVESSQQITWGFVPEHDRVVTGTAGEQISWVEGDWNNASVAIARRVECLQQGVICMNVKYKKVFNKIKCKKVFNSLIIKFQINSRFIILIKMTDKSLIYKYFEKKICKYVKNNIRILWYWT